MFSTGFTLLSVLFLFPLSITFLVFMHSTICLDASVHLLCHLTQMSFSWSTHLLLCLSLESLTSIIRTSLLILVNSVIIYLSPTTLLRWLTFLHRSLTVTLTVLLFWIYLFFLMLVFVLQWFFLHYEILNMLFSQFPLTFQ